MDNLEDLKTIKYPFKLTMRELCKFLDKRGLEDVEPVSVSNDETETTVLYKSISVEERLKVLFGTNLSNNRLISSPKTPTALDISLYEKVGSTRLIERQMGRYWKFIFDDNHILTKLVTPAGTFHRSTSSDVGGFEEDPDDEMLRFFCPKNAWEFDAIFLRFVFDDEKRSDKVIVSGEHYYDLEAGERRPISGDSSISWVKK